ncbi:MAG: adenine phosphoribosyltransferase [Bacillota bacterium]
MENLKEKIREIPDFPKPGISFKDISTLIKEGPAFQNVVEQMIRPFMQEKIDLVVGVESRGFIFAAPIACKLGAGIVIVRKPGKLPAETVKVTYQLEYGTDSLEMHKDAIKPGQTVLIVDDVLATGGTMAATAQLVENLRGKIAGFTFVIELDALNGRKKLAGKKVASLVHY